MAAVVTMQADEGERLDKRALHLRAANNARAERRRAKLPGDARVLNPDRLSHHIPRPCAESTKKKYASLRKNFIKWTETVQGHLPGQPGHGEEFFGPSAPAPELRVVREFLRDHALGGQGVYDGKTLPDKNSEADLSVSPRTVITWADNLIGAMKYEQRVPPDGKYAAFQLMRNWVKADLTPELGLNTARRDKPLATNADIAIIIDLLFRDSSIEQLSFADPEEMRDTVLRITLQQDTACRFGDLTNLKWRQVQFFLFPHSNGIFIRAKILWDAKKGRKGDPTKDTYSVLRNLEPHRLLEDSCIQLFTRGLRTGVFQGLSSVSELLAIQPHVDGRPIQLKPEYNMVPVFSKPDNTERIENNFREHLRILGQLAGFEHTLTMQVGQSLMSCSGR